MLQWLQQQDRNSMLYADGELLMLLLGSVRPATAGVSK
jgi:hypothetical protein